MVYEAAYNTALEAVASGASYEDTHDAISKAYPQLLTTRREAVLKEAHRDALKQGVEREDIDDSWYAADESAR